MKRCCFSNVFLIWLISPLCHKGKFHRYHCRQHWLNINIGKRNNDNAEDNDIIKTEVLVSLQDFYSLISVYSQTV